MTYYEILGVTRESSEKEVRLTLYSWAAAEKDLHYINNLAQFNFQEM